MAAAMTVWKTRGDRVDYSVISPEFFTLEILLCDVDNVINVVCVCVCDKVYHVQSFMSCGI